jgi:DNA-binding NtrC family response regulator
MQMLIVDDQPGIRALCATLGGGMGLVCRQAESAGEALERVDRDAPELMLADLVLGRSSGLELLAEVKKRSPQTEVVLMSACGTMESAVQAMRLGASDFIVKPFRAEEFRLLLERMVEKVRRMRENELLRVLGSDLGELERLTVRRVFAQVDGDKEQARRLLGISRATLYRKLKRYGIQTRQMRQQHEDTEPKYSRGGAAG